MSLNWKKYVSLYYKPMKNEECNVIVAMSTPEDFLKWLWIRRRW